MMMILVWIGIIKNIISKHSLTDELRRGAGCLLSLLFKDTSHNQIAPRYKAAKRRRLQRGLGGAFLPE